MNRLEAEDVFRRRQTIVDNLDKLINSSKKSKKAESKSSFGQMSLFDIGLDDCKEPPKMVEYEGNIRLMDYVNLETEILGVPITYNPLDELWMYKELYCTNEVVDLLEFVENKSGVVILDRITNIDRRVSKTGNNYVKIFTSLLGADRYMYLTGSQYKTYIPQVFINEIYLFFLDYRTATPEFSIDSVSIKHLKNIRDVDISSEYERLTKSIDNIVTLNESWQLKNQPIEVQEFVNKNMSSYEKND